MSGECDKCGECPMDCLCRSSGSIINSDYMVDWCKKCNSCNQECKCHPFPGAMGFITFGARSCSIKPGPPETIKIDIIPQWSEYPKTKPEKDCLCVVTNKSHQHEFIAIYNKSYDIFVEVNHFVYAPPAIAVTHYIILPDLPESI